MGTVINVIAVLVGSSLGFLLRARFSEKLKVQMLQGIGLITILLGIQMGLKTERILIPLGGILLGGIAGYLMGLEEKLNALGKFIGDRFVRNDNNGNFLKGFVTSSLIFCVGPMTILGAINDGLYGDYQLLAIKSALDGFTSLALTASLGIGVFFSIVTIIVFQGGLTVLATYMSAFFSQEVINETTATGGIIIIGLGIVILELRQLSVTNFLPAIFISPLIVKIVDLLLR